MEALEEPATGYRGKVALEYDIDYAVRHLDVMDSHSLSCRYPPSFELWTEAPWPAFVFDILPGGAARQVLLEHAGLADTRAADWPLLSGAHHAPGNVRVRPASGDEPPAPHPGFDRAEIVERGPDFVEYAFQRGASIAGSSGAQGEAPKFLLVEDVNGRWHAEGGVVDAAVAQRWLVKFPRGRHPTDLTILEEEARYMELARKAGLRANAPLEHDEACLFVPRFDRPGGERLGLESMASLLGISDYGVRRPLQAFAAAIAEFCSDPTSDLRELLVRDVFNQAVGNTDNHVRNTSVLKHPDGRIALSPLYDLAPMVLDRSGIPRASRWGERETAAGVDWSGVVADLEALGAPASDLRDALRHMAAFVDALEEHMLGAGVDRDLVARLRPRQRELAAAITRGVES